MEREYLIRQGWEEKAHGGYVNVEVAEFVSGSSRPDYVVEVTLWHSGRSQECDCQGDERRAKCRHVAIAQTWKRQKRPTGTRPAAMLEQVRVYTIGDDDHIGYYKDGKHVRLSNWKKVVGLKT